MKGVVEKCQHCIRWLNRMSHHVFSNFQFGKNDYHGTLFILQILLQVQDFYRWSPNPSLGMEFSLHNHDHADGVHGGELKCSKMCKFREP